MRPPAGLLSSLPQCSLGSLGPALPPLPRLLPCLPPAAPEALAGAMEQLEPWIQRWSEPASKTLGT